MIKHALFVIAIAGCGSKGAKPADNGSGSGSGSGSSSGSGSGSAIAATGSGSGSGSADDKKPEKVCLTSNQGQVEAFAADDKTATVCVKLSDGDPGTRKCLALDLATNKWSFVGNAPASPAKPSIDRAKLDLPKLEADQQYELEASADGKLVITTATIGKKPSIVILDAATGKRTKTVPLGNESSECLEGAHFLGDAFMAITSVCAGPGGSGYFYDKTGKLLNHLDPTRNIFGAIPAHLDGDRWAFAEFGSGSFVVVDATTGKEVGHYSEPALPEGQSCDDCMQAAGPAFVDDPLRVVGGKIAMLSGAGLSMIDAKSLAPVKPTHLPVCLANTAAPTAP